MPHSTVKNSLSLTIVEGSADSYVEALRASAKGDRLGKVILCPVNALAKDISGKISKVMQVDEVILTDHPPTDGADAWMFCFDDAEKQSAALFELVDLDSGIVIAAETEGSGLKNGLYLISIPKSGTHMAVELMHAFGYRDGDAAGASTTPGYWKYLEFSNSHTSASDFFIDTVRRSPFGNRLHPLPHTPILFIYRHPYDILLSEANYYHKEGKTVFFQYLKDRSFEDRVQCLIDDPWLMGTLRERVGKYIPWLAFENVIPISFEELVGEAGGGDAGRQERLIWSIILKLQVSANVSDVASVIFNQESPTFHSGQINSHVENLPPAAWEILSRLPMDYLEAFGYAHDPSGANSPFGRRSEEFRKRPLRLAPSQFDQAPPVAVLLDEHGHNIIMYKGRYIAVPITVGDVDLTSLTDLELEEYLTSETIDGLRQILLENVLDRRFRGDDEFLGNDIIKYGGRYYGVAKGTAPFDIGIMPIEERSKLPNAVSTDELKQILLSNFLRHALRNLVPDLKDMEEVFYHSRPTLLATKEKYWIFKYVNHFIAIAKPSDDTNELEDIQVLIKKGTMAHSLWGLKFKILMNIIFRNKFEF